MNSDPNGQPSGERQSRKRPHVLIEDSDSNEQDGYATPPGNAQASSSQASSSRAAPSSVPLSLPPLVAPGYNYRPPPINGGLFGTSPFPSPSLHSLFRPRSPQAQPQQNEQNAVIDLTQDSDDSPTRPPRSRPPRFGRNIMSDVVDLEAEPEPSTIQGEPSSPEVQFMGATRRPQPAQPRPPSVEQAYGTLRSLFGPRLGFADVFAQFTDEERFRQIMEQSSRSMIELWIGGARARRGEDVDLAIDLDNGDPFDLNYTETSRREPEYVPPPAAPEGFTRTPKAGDVAVCPNCDNELGAGEEPLGRQIWVSKQCGHVYCGLCAKNRALSKNKKQERARNPNAPKPFSKCVVEGCEKVVSPPKAMFQLYL